jgi:seryl-tRNA synthetase
MHDARTLIDLGDEAVRRLARRGCKFDLTTIEDLFTRRNSLIKSADELRAESKKVAQEVGQAARTNSDASGLMDHARQLKDQVRTIEDEHQKVEVELTDLLLTIPNFPDEDVPDGHSEQFNVEVRKYGSPPVFAYDPKDHVSLGEAMGIFDFGRAARLAGARCWSGHWHRSS